MKAILHVDKEWGIGKSNALMFRIPEDMKFFKQTTVGNVVVLGANTLKSFPNGKPLKDRVNIVFYPQGDKRYVCSVVGSLEELFCEIKKYDTDNVFVIGGAMTYKTLLPYCDEVLVTKVDAVGGADTFFENLVNNSDFKLIYESPYVETNGYKIKFTTYKNTAVKAY